MQDLAVLNRQDVFGLVPFERAVETITDALTGGLDPTREPARSRVDIANGQFLVMPSDESSYCGVKVLSVARDNTAYGLPAVQGQYLLFEQPTLRPVAVIDASALTELRTPAVSLSAVLPVLPARADLEVVVFGQGVQAYAHLDCLLAVLPKGADIGRATFVARRPDPLRTARYDMAESLGALDKEVGRRLAGADLVICATGAREPLFDSGLIRDESVVVAVGSHEPDAREVDGRLGARATVVVEDVATALRESGDVVLAVREGLLDPDDLVPLKDFVSDAAARERSAGRPVFFKSSGMAWEDLAVAARAYRRHTGQDAAS
ncbi:ornithine cyclodeaminase family protein [Streptomyces sp. NPDC002680]|uniref:ornithine cyclodeaminase family protein n=1 Tax=Streptomyces sp. NPDC002680 TaxID=3364659 RepID=UPI00369C0CFC